MLLMPNGGYTYLLGPFRFGVDAAAPLPSPYTEAGAVGSLTVTDASSKLSIASDKLVLIAGAATSNVKSAGLARVAGRAFLVDFNLTAYGVRFDWGQDATDAAKMHGVLFASAAPFLYVSGGNPTTGDSVALATTYRLALILRATGCFYFIQGGAFTNWTLIWVDPAGTLATVYPYGIVAHTSAGAGTIDNLRVLDLGSLVPVFATPYGLATNRLASVAAGTQTAGNADLLLDYTFSYAGTPCYVQYRRTSATNSWEVDADSGTLTLYQVVAGVYSSRGTVAATFTATNTYRIIVVAEGNVHKVYVNNVLKITYTDAGNFQNTATGISADAVSASMSELVAWPRIVSLPAGI